MNQMGSAEGVQIVVLTLYYLKTSPIGIVIDDNLIVKIFDLKYSRVFRTNPRRFGGYNAHIRHLSNAQGNLIDEHKFITR